MISVIIPNYNDAETLPLCLEAVLSSECSNFEVIVVDDKSTDNSVEIINKYNVRLLMHNENQGQAAARNTGAKQAKGEILLFTDGDVCLKKNTLENVADIFSRKKEIAAIVGMPDKECVYQNLSSIHFNRRIHFNYLKLPDYINVLYGTISAVKKEAFCKIGGFTEGMTGVEDNEIGFRLVDSGYKIHHSKDIHVIHHKKIYFLQLLKNDFKRTVDRMKLLLGRKQLKSVVSEKRFITSPMYQLLSPFLSFFFFLFASLGFLYCQIFLLSSFALLMFVVLNMGYLSFNSKEEGALLSIKLFNLLLIDMFIVFTALVWGGLLFLKGEKY